MKDFATARLTAEKLDLTHLNDLTRLHLDPDVSLYLGGVRSPEATKTYLDINLAHWAEHGFGLWMFRIRDGTFVGRAGLRHIKLESAHEIEISSIAFCVTTGARGWQPEAARALINLWLTQTPLPVPRGRGICRQYSFPPRAEEVRLRIRTDGCLPRHGSRHISTL